MAGAEGGWLEQDIHINNQSGSPAKLRYGSSDLQWVELGGLPSGDSLCLGTYGGKDLMMEFVFMSEGEARSPPFSKGDTSSMPFPFCSLHSCSWIANKWVERVQPSSQFEKTESDMARKAPRQEHEAASCSYFVHSQEAESRQEVGRGYETSRAPTSDPLPPPRLHLSKIPTSF